jgi:hypothetical protein
LKPIRPTTAGRSRSGTFVGFALRETSPSTATLPSASTVPVPSKPPSNHGLSPVPLNSPSAHSNLGYFS